MWGRLISGQIGNYTFVVMSTSVGTISPLITEEIPLVLWKLEPIFTFQRACNRNSPQLSTLIIILKSSKTLLPSDFMTKIC